MILEEEIGAASPVPRTAEPRLLAAAALAAWNLGNARLTLLEQKKNITFRVDDDPRPGAAGGRYLLRLCDPDGYSPDEIAAEAAWLLALRREAGIVVPEPVAAADGSFVARAEERNGILFRWIPGTTLDSSITPEMLVRLGELLGRMHAFGRLFVPPPGFARPRYDGARILGDPEILPRDWSGSLLTRRDRDLLAEAARVVRAGLAGLGEGPEIFGMIHSDPEPDNMVQRDGEIYPIDFADCGWGYYLYDLAAALLPLGEKRDLAELRQALLAGYLRTHPLPPGHVDLLDTFLIARGLFALRWMLVEGWWREAVRAYAGTAVPHILSEVRRFLDGIAGMAGSGRSASTLARLSTVRFLAHLRGLGIQLAAEDDRLRMRAPKGALTAELQEEIAARKPEILAALRRSAVAAAVPPLVRVPCGPQEGQRLSFSQRQLWFLDQLDPGNPSYNIPQAVQMTGSLRPDLLEKSLGEVMRRQASLRTSFAAGPEEPVQFVAPRLVPRVPVIDLRALPEGTREAETARLTREEARRTFALAVAPLLRFTLLRLADEEHRALVTAHHIVSDGQSGGVLIRELATIYEAALRGEPSPLPEPPVQYTDYAHWQRQWLNGERLAEKLVYWRERLRDLPAVLDLPFDRPRPSLPTPRGGRLDVEIPAGLTGRLRELGRADNATLFMVLLAGFAALLERLSGRRDVVVGSPVANRARAETEGLIGFFVNTVVLRLQVEGAGSFRALLEEVRRTTQEAYAQQDLPFEKLVEELRPERSLSHTPLFQVLFNFQTTALPELRLGGLLLRWISTQGGVEKFELNLGLRETREGIAIALSYRQDLFDATTVMRLAGHYLALLAHAAGDPERPAGHLPLLSAAERQQLVEWNDTAEVFAGEPCLHELVFARAAETPDAVAVACEDRSVTYGELIRRSGRLADRLRRRGVRREVPVGLCVERSPEMVVGILGILAAGGAYVPLDPAYPPARLEYMLADAGAAVLLTTEALAERLLLGGGGGRTVIRLDGTDGDGAGEAAGRAFREDRPAPANLAYVIYTSGSTGQPKGAMNTHEGVRNRILWGQRTFGLTAADRVLQKTPFSFDVSVWELLWPLMVGARLVMARPGGHLDPGYLVDLVVREGITTLHFVPPMLGVFLEQDGLEHCRPVRRVLASGEALTPELEGRFHEHLGWARLFNLYGPTEASIEVSWWPCVADSQRTTVPIGRPVANVRLYVLDAAARPVPLGVAGELHIGGIALARGYWRRPELTAERFVPDPVSAEPGARLYRTGDLTRLRAAGEIEYLGRIDHQVKVRGFRIELGEIEAVLRSHPAVRDGVVLAREDVPGSHRLVAYVVVAEAGDVPTAEALGEHLGAHLGTRLPGYMLPSAFVRLDELPLNPNGKVDRKALPAPERPRAATGGTEGPADPVEELLAGIWAEVLKVDRVGVHEDFFALGGHSLLGAQVVSRLRTAFAVELPLRTLFERPTVAGLARAVRALRGGGGEPAPPLVPVPRTGDLPLSFAQQRLWFIDQLEPGSPVYNIPIALRLSGGLQPSVLARVFAEVARRHEVLRTRFANRGGEPVQVVEPELEPALPVVDLAALPAARREAQARELAREEGRRSFDLQRGPLMRLLLCRLGESEHVLAITLHHIIADGWSLGVLLREVTALYAVFSRGSQGLPSPLPELPVQYADFAVWQRGWLAGEVMERQVEHWRRQLAGAPPRLELPTDRPRPAVQTFRGAFLPVALPKTLTDDLAAFGRRLGATPFMMFLAVFQALLSRLSGQEDVLVGTPIAGRTRREIEGLIGFFVNTLVLRGDLTGGPELRQLVTRVRDTALAAYEHQDLPFERLVEELAPERSLACSPLFQVAFALQNAPAGDAQLPGLSLSTVSTGGAVARWDLTFTLGEGPAGFTGAIAYATALFDSTTVGRLVEQFHTLLEGVRAHPDRRLLDLPLLSAAGRHQILSEWSAEPAPGLPDISLDALFAEQAARRPDAPAVVWDGGCLSYAGLDRQARRLARHLRGLGVGPEVPVAFCLERSPEMVITTLAILQAGGAYVPLDPGAPAERLAWMLGDAGAAVLVTTRSLLDRLPAIGTAGARVVLLERLPEDGAEERLPAGHPDGHGLAYVMYTSGSTGRPKGVAVVHRAVVRLVRGRFARFGPEQSWGQAAPASFDAATLEIWGALLHGGRLALLPDPPEPRALSEALVRLGVTSLWLTAALFHQMVEEELAGLAPLTQLLAGGDVLSPAHVRRALAAHPDLRLINGYGPTESTTFTSCQPLYGPDEVEGSVPLGRPIAYTRVGVLDGRLSPVPVGVEGELYVGGDGLARGYRGRPDLTAERFVPDPASGAGVAPGARLYRTGDRVRWLADGRLDFLGRVDRQVKIRGFRIEPGEVEAALASHPGLREAVVDARPDPADPAGGRCLVAWVVPAGEEAPSDRELRSFLQERLPAYMVPAAWVGLEALPVTANGKIDRRALPEPEKAARPREHAAPCNPRNPIEELLCTIWSEVLQIETIGVHDSFFELGGHSLLATRLASRLREVFGQELPLRLILAAPTVAELAETVAALREERPAPPILPVPRQPAMPLSFAQQRLWFLDRLIPESPLYNIFDSVRLIGPLQIGALRRACAEIVRRHEVLRTTFAAVEGSPVQVIAAELDPGVEEIDLRALPEGPRGAELARLSAEESRRPFDLSRGPLLRLRAVAMETGDHTLLVSFHHIVADGWSMGVLLRELGTLYGAFVEGAFVERVPLPELPIQYADFAVWQREWFQGEVFQRQLEYWRSHLAGMADALELPYDRPRPSIETFQGDREILRLPAAVFQGLRELSRRCGATLFMTSLAGFQMLLAACSGGEDVAVGTAIANRNRREIEGLIGFFVNTLVLRSDLSGAPCFRLLLQRVRETALAAYDHQDLPFELLVEELRPARSLSRHPLVQTFIAFQSFASPVLELRGLRIEALERPLGGAAKLDLTLFLREDGDELRGHLEYNRHLFDAVTIRRLLDHFATLLGAIVAAPEAPLAELPLLTEGQRHQMIREWSSPVPLPVPRGTFPELFAARAARCPDRVAVELAEDRLSYGELDDLSGRLARRLRRWGVGPEVVVGLCMERSVEMIVALLGILKAGGAYLPLDPAVPRERQAFLLADSGARLVLAQERWRRDLAEVDVTVLGVEELLASPGESTEPLPAPSPGDLAYVIYTSGSTGRPKGVLVNHGTVVHFASALRQAVFADSPEGSLRVSLNAPIVFDASMQQIVQLLSGRTLCLVPQEVRLDGAAFVSYLARHGVDVLDSTPSHLRLLLDAGLGAVLASPARVLCGGEAIDEGLWGRLVERRGIRFWNVYGPTECTVNATACRIGPEASRPLLGHALPGYEILVLSRDLQPVAPSVTGELYIGGAGLARGYLGRAELTADRFVPHPFATAPGARLYRTGDLGRRLADGQLEYLGRGDSQVKIRGYRVETGEIESMLRGHPEVRECAVLARPDGSGTLGLVAYVVPPAGTRPAVEALRAFLRERLPAYMVPSAFGFLPALPTTLSGKVDRRALPPLADAASADCDVGGSAPLPPRDLLELRLTQLWEELLGSGPVGVSDDFFELGGHSLLAVRLLAEIRARFGRELPLATLYGGATVERLAAALRDTGPPARREILVPIRPGGSRPPLFLVHPVGGNVLCYAALARYLGPDQPVWGLQTPCPEERRQDLPAMAAAYVEAVERVAPEGPRLLAGWSLGAAVAFEMACQLAAAGRPVDRLVFIDPPGTATGRGGAPDPRALASLFARDLAGSSAHRVAVPSIEGDDPIPALLAVAAQAGVLPTGTGREEIRELFAQFCDNFLALHGYTPGPYAGRATAFLAAARTGEPDLVAGWRSLIAGGLEMEELPGDHWSVLREPYVRTLAARLAARLKEER